MTFKTVRVEWTGLGGSPWLSTFNTQEGDDRPAGLLVDYVEELMGDVSGAIYAGITMRVLGEVLERNAADGSIVAIDTSNDRVVVGQTAADPVPVTSQILMRLVTGQVAGGRRIQGRLFIPGLTEPASVGGRPDPAMLALLVDFFEDFNGDFGMGVWSRSQGTVYSVEGFSAWSEWAVLRSRRD